MQNPTKLNLGSEANWPANQLRRDKILRDMNEVGFLTKAQLDEALAGSPSSAVLITAIAGTAGTVGSNVAGLFKSKKREQPGEEDPRSEDSDAENA